MFWGKFQISCVIFCLWVSIVSAGAQESSFRSIVKTGLRFEGLFGFGSYKVQEHAKVLSNDWGRACLENFYEFFQDGGAVSRNTFPHTYQHIQKYSSPLVSYFHTQVYNHTMEYYVTTGIVGLPLNNIFYHYFSPENNGFKQTEIKNIAAILKANEVERNSCFVSQKTSQSVISQMLFASRTDDQNFGSGMFSLDHTTAGTIYSAANYESSSDYGDHLLALEFNLESIVLDMSYSLGKSNLLKEINKDMMANLDLATSNCKPSKIALMILEELGVDLIHYDENKDWFQILSPKNVRSIRVQDMDSQSPMAFEIKSILTSVGRESETDLHYEYPNFKNIENRFYDFLEFKDFEPYQSWTTLPEILNEQKD